jgi:hypothetical protein
MKKHSKTTLLAILLFAHLSSSADEAFDELLEEGIFLDNLPPWELYEAPPKGITQDPPVYLDIDANGNVHVESVTVSKSGSFEFSDVILSESEVAEIRKARTVVLQDMESAQVLGGTLNQGSMLLG